MELNNIGDGVVEHVEAGSLVDGSPCRLARIDQVENGGENLVHALHILNSGVDLGIDVENSGHIVVAVGLPLQLLGGDEVFVSLFILAVDEFELLPAGAGQIGDHDFRGRSGKERQLGMRAGCVLFDLLPQVEILLELRPSLVLLAHDNGVIGELFLREEHVDELLIGFMMLIHDSVPVRFLLRQVAQDYLPAILPQHGCLIGDPFREKGLQFSDVDHLLVQHIHEPLHFADDEGRQSLGPKLFYQNPLLTPLFVHYLILFTVQKEESPLTKSQISNQTKRKVSDEECSARFPTA